MKILELFSVAAIGYHRRRDPATGSLAPKTVKAASEREQSEARFQNAEREQARPQVKPERDFDREPYTTDEVVRRLSPHGDRAGEWYCTSRQRRMAWRIDMVDAEGLIVRKLVHDMREHTISKAPETGRPETVEQLARI